MNLIFQFVAEALRLISSITGFSYNEINIIAYYLILPFVYVALLDRIMKRHYLKIVYVFSWLTFLMFVPSFRLFSDALFMRSVDFLLLFNHIGLDYVAASVVVCVILPGIALLFLMYFAFPSLRSKFFKQTTHDAP